MNLSDWANPGGESFRRAKASARVFRVPMVDPLAQISATGGYPWRIEETSNTVVYIKNMTGLEQEYHASLSWENGGKYTVGHAKIGPHETIVIDVKELRDKQTPDFRGKKIPPGQTNGQIKWSLFSKHQTGDLKTDTLGLIGRSEQIDTINKPAVHILARTVVRVALPMRLLPLTRPATRDRPATITILR